MSVLFLWPVPFSGPRFYVFLLRRSSLFSGGREDGGDFRVSLAPQLFFFFGEDHVTCADAAARNKKTRKKIEIYFSSSIYLFISSRQYMAVPECRP